MEASRAMTTPGGAAGAEPSIYIGTEAEKGAREAAGGIILDREPTGSEKT